MATNNESSVAPEQQPDYCVSGDNIDCVASGYGKFLAAIALALLIASSISYFFGCDPDGEKGSLWAMIFDEKDTTSTDGQVLTYEDIAARIGKTDLVHDMAGLLSQEKAQLLEHHLDSLSRAGLVEICLVTVAEDVQEPISEQATALFEAIGIGDEQKNNGALMLISPKTSSHKGIAHITTGYGLEGTLPDLLCKTIVDENMIPYFKSEDYATGIFAGVNNIVKAVGSDAVIESPKVEIMTPTTFWILFGVIVALSIVGIILYKRIDGLIGWVFGLSIAIDFLYFFIYMIWCFVTYDDLYFPFPVDALGWPGYVAIGLFALFSFYHVFALFSFAGMLLTAISRSLFATTPQRKEDMKDNDYGLTYFFMTATAALMLWLTWHSIMEYVDSDGIWLSTYILILIFFFAGPLLTGYASDDFEPCGKSRWKLILPALAFGFFAFLKECIQDDKGESTFASYDSGGGSYSGSSFGHSSGGFGGGSRW
ncbi:MAG: TPM domain-containing protein [Bacteroidales bacterium]|nr:TPM domain-containing protein [Bacteroidales bacterium]